MRLIVSTVLSLALVAISSPIVAASKAKTKTLAPPSYCPVNSSHAGWGIVLVDAQSSPQPNGTNYLCTYEHQDTSRPLPADGVGFMVACPSGSRLVSPGFSFLNRSWRTHRITDEVPVSGSGGEDMMQYQVAPDGTGYTLKITVRALCRP